MVIVNLNKYQILLKTVELGSITRAAEALGYTQSAVSRVIADLEREWDMELLTRSRTGVVLSSSGAALLPYVQAVCNAGRELEEQVASLTEQAEKTSQAMDWFWQINEAYVRGKYALCRQLMESLEKAGLKEWLPQESVTDNGRFSPADRYQEIYDALH